MAPRSLMRAAKWAVVAVAPTLGALLFVIVFYGLAWLAEGAVK